jgi:hypothetical protein
MERYFLNLNTFLWLQNKPAVVAVLELLWPEEEEKKNEICEPVQTPHDLQDWFINFRISLRKKQKLRKVLGLQRLWTR